MDATPDNEQQLTFLDLYAGCGGLSLGLMKAGWQGLFAIEKHPFAFQTLRHNLIDSTPPWQFDWPNWLPVAPIDILKFKTKYKSQLKDLKGEIKLIAGGPPCQGYSLMRKRDPNDSRNKLVNAYLELVEILQPDLVLLENVKGITVPFDSDDNSSQVRLNEETLSAAEEIKRTLSGNYFTFDDIIIASSLGVPQNRPRYIQISVNKKLIPNYLSVPSPFDTLEEMRQMFLETLGLPTDRLISVGEAISDLLKEHGTVQCAESPKFQVGQYGNEDDPYKRLLRLTREGNQKEPGSIPDSHRFVNHKKPTIAKFKKIMEIAYGRHLSVEERKSLGIKKNTIAVLSGSEPAYTLTTLPDDRIHYVEPRILTAREYARIQSFPDWFVFKGNYTTGGKARKGDAPRYTQIGNAVPPLMAEGLGRSLKKYYLDLLKTTTP